MSHAMNAFFDPLLLAIATPLVVALDHRARPAEALVDEARLVGFGCPR
jgi:hypothetical protein